MASLSPPDGDDEGVDEMGVVIMSDLATGADDERVEEVRKCVV